MEEIKARNQNFMKWFEEGNTEALSGLYTEDCKMMPAGCDVLVGREGERYGT